MKFRRFAARSARGFLNRAFGDLSTSAQAMAVKMGYLHLRILESRIDDVVELSDVEYPVFTKWGEDGILDFLCLKLGVRRPHIVDLGAGDVRESNGRWLLTHLGGSAVLVDARNDLQLTLKMSGLQIISNSIGIKSFITSRNINDIMRICRTHLDNNIDFLSIDLDGQDYWILRAIEKLDAKIIVLEYLGILGSEVSISVPQDVTFDRTKAHFSWLYYGASLRAYLDLMKERGYQFVGTNSQNTNAFFVRQDLAHMIPSSLLESIQPLRYYTDVRINESRNASGEITAIQGDERLDLLRSQIYVDTRTQEAKMLSQHLTLRP